MSPFTTRNRARAFALTAIVILGTSACQARDGQTGTDPAAKAPPTVEAIPEPVASPAIEAILANVQAARSQHDARAIHQHLAQLRDQLGDAAIERADAAYRQILADLQASDARHDAKARAAFRGQLRALCDPTSVTGAIEPCDGAVSSGS